MVRLNLEFPSPRGGFLMAVSAVALAAVASPSLAIDVVRSENWDGDWAANWTIEGGVWEVGRPLNTGIGEPTLPAGQNCAATSLNANYPDGADARLVWSLMDIPATNPRLRFSHWMRMQSNDYGYIAIRIEGSDLWTEVSDFCADVGRGDQNSCAIAFDTHDVWVPVSIDLSDYAGERAEVAFVFHSNSAYNDVGWYIDNVQMESGGYDFDLAQGWESGFQGWHAAMGDWEVGTPNVEGGPGAPQSGSSCIGTLLTTEYPKHHSSRLVSPFFEVPADRARLRFWQWLNCHSGDLGTVWIRQRDADVWTKIGEDTPTDTYGVWAPVTLDLSRFAGTEVELSFLFNATSGYRDAGWFLDGIQIESGDYEFDDFAQDWEGDWDGWHAARGVWEVGTPNVEGGPGAPQSGSSCIGTLLTAEYPKHHSSRLVSPFFEVPTDRARLRFWQWLNCHSGDLGTVWIRQRGADVWTKIGEDTPTDTYGVWAPVTLDLSRFAGMEVELSFLFNATSGYRDAGWFLDGIQIESGDYEFDDLAQDWEGDWDGWHAARGVWEVGTPNVEGGPGAPQSGSSCIGTLLTAEYPKHHSSRLVSPFFEVPADRARLRFWQWLNCHSGDLGTVWIRQRDADVWTKIGEDTPTDTYGVWAPVTLDLSRFAGTEVELSFLFNATSGYRDAGWFLDGIQIESGDYEVPLVEDWEDGYGDWSAPQGVWEIGDPVGGPGEPSRGEACIGTLLNVNYPTWVQVNLVSPPMEIPAAGSAFLRFHQWMRVRSNDSGRVDYLAPGDEWRNLLQVASTTSGWEEVSIALPNNLNGENVQFRFQFSSISGYSDAGWFLDDISVASATPPTVSAVQPQSGTVVGASRPSIEVQFDQSVLGATTASAWEVEGSVSGTHNGQVTSVDNTTVRFEPSSDFVDGETVTVTLNPSSSVITSADGIPLARYDWSFGVAFDSVCPTVASITPVDGATNIEPQSRIRVVFDEPVVGADDVLAWSVESARAGALQGQVKLIGCCTYEWHPDAALPYGDTITIRLDADRIQDLSGNDMCGDYHASFTVREIVAQPTTYTYTPAIPGGRYVLITVPLDVEAGDHLSDVFSALGSMSESKWLGYGFENEEYRLDPGVVAGKGYWIALAAENSRAVQITGNAHSDPVRVELEAGWNLVGVPWISEQFFWADQAVDTGTEFVSFGSEEARDWIADAVYWYEDDSADLQNNGGYQYRTTADGATLAENPWGGYFVYAEQDCELVFSQTPLRSGVSLAQHRTMSRKIPSWSVSIRASAGSGSDGNVRIGTVASAREVEVRKPPLPTGSVSLSVEESGHSFLTSYRGEGSVDSWLLGLSGPAESVTLTWEGVESLPAGQNLYLRTESGRVVRMGDSGELNVWNPGHSRIEVFSSMTELSDATPQNLQLRPMQNPLRGRGTFELSLPESGPVEVQIVDVTGRSVATLVSGWREAGTHSLEWSPATEQLPGGIYFARVQAGREVAREKLIVLR